MNSVTPTISNFFSPGKLLGPPQAQVVSEVSCKLLKSVESWRKTLKYLPFYGQKMIHSRKLTWQAVKSPCSIGNTSSNGGCSMTMLVFGGVFLKKKSYFFKCRIWQIRSWAKIQRSSQVKNASHHQDYYIFRIRNLQKNLHLLPESWVGVRSKWYHHPKW